MYWLTLPFFFIISIIKKTVQNYNLFLCFPQFLGVRPSFIQGNIGIDYQVLDDEK
jgi:hypothetical protein